MVGFGELEWNCEGVSNGGMCVAWEERKDGEEGA